MPTGRVYKRGDKWYVYINTGRKIDDKYERIRHKCEGRTKAQAQAELDEMLYKLRRIGKSGRATNNNYPIKDICDEWAEHIQRTHSDLMLIAEYTRHPKRLADALTYAMVSEMTLESIEEALAKIAAEKSTNTANKALAKMKAALEYGVDRGVIVSNPLKKAKQLKTIRKKFRRALTHDEGRMLLKVAPEPWRTIWRFILATGIRRDEMIYLRRSDVDLKRGTVRIQERIDFKPKTNAGSRTIPLSPGIRPALEKVPINDDGVMFKNDCGRPMSSWALTVFRRHMKEALIRLARINKRFGHPLPEDVIEKDGEFVVNISKLDLHAMRYTFITEMIASGVDPKTVQYLAGHKDIKTTLAIYAQVKGYNIENAMANWRY